MKMNLRAAVKCALIVSTILLPTLVMSSRAEERIASEETLSHAQKLARDTKFITFLLLDERVGNGKYTADDVEHFFQSTRSEDEYRSINERICGCYFARCLELWKADNTLEGRPQVGVYSPEYPMNPNEDYVDRYVQRIINVALANRLRWPPRSGLPETFIYFPPGPARRKLFEKLLSSGLLHPALMERLAGITNMFEDEMLKDIKAAFDLFESDGLAEMHLSLPEEVLDKPAIHRFFEPDRVLRILPEGVNKLDHLIALFKDPMYCSEEAAFNQCIKYLSVFDDGQSLEKALKPVLEFNPTIMAESGDENLVNSILSEHPILVEATLRGFAKFRPGTAKHGFHKSPKTVSLIKNLLSRIDDSLERAKYTCLLNFKVPPTESNCKVALACLYESATEEIIPGIPNDILAKIGVIPKIVSKTAYYSPYTTSPLNPIVFFDCIDQSGGLAFSKLPFNHPVLLLDDVDLKLAKQFHDFILGHNLLARQRYMKYLTSHHLKLKGRFTSFSRNHKLSISEDFLMHDLVFRQGSFADKKFERQQYFKMLEAVAMVVHWERMMELKAARDHLQSDPSDIVALFTCKFVNKKWVLARLVSLVTDGPKSFIQLLEDSTSRTELFKLNLDQDLTGLGYNGCVDNVAWMMGSMACILATQKHDHSLMDVWCPQFDEAKKEHLMAALSSHTKLSDQESDIQKLMFCIERPLTLSKGCAFMEHVFPFLSLPEKLEVLAELPKNSPFNQDILACIPQGGLHRSPAEEVIEIAKFLMTKSISDGDENMALWVMNYVMRNSSRALQSLGSVITYLDVHLLSKSDYFDLSNFLHFQRASLAASTSLLMELVRLMATKAEWETEKSETLQTLFTAIFYRTARTKEAWKVTSQFFADTKFDIDYSSILENGCHLFTSFLDDHHRSAITALTNIRSVTIVDIEVDESVTDGMNRGKPHLFPTNNITHRQVYSAARDARYRRKNGMFALLDLHGNAVPCDDTLLPVTSISHYFKISFEYEHVKEAVMPLGIDMTKPSKL